MQLESIQCSPIFLPGWRRERKGGELYEGFLNMYFMSVVLCVLITEGKAEEVCLALGMENHKICGSS